MATGCPLPPAAPSSTCSRRSAAIGTDLANLEIGYSYERPAGWGGARLSGARTSDGLTAAQAAALIDAAAFAMATGRPFQRHWIVHYGKAGIAAADGARFVTRLLSLASKHARRHGGDMAAVWVRERASAKGEHVHILLHLPPHIRLGHRTRRWIECAGGTYAAGVSRVRIIAGRLPRQAGTGAGHAMNAENVLRYMLKGVDAATGRALDLTRADCPGTIIGKRCGTTQNIAAKARGRAKSR